MVGGGGWSEETKLILNSTLVKFKLKLELEFGNDDHVKSQNP